MPRCYLYSIHRRGTGKVNFVFCRATAVFLKLVSSTFCQLHKPIRVNQPTFYHQTWRLKQLHNDLHLDIFTTRRPMETQVWANTDKCNCSRFDYVNVYVI